MNLNDALRHALRGMQSEAQLYIAYSGGLDSQVLLQLAVEYAATSGVDVTALHVNHGLSPNANQWQSFCDEYCKNLKIPFLVKRVDLKGAVSGNLEQRARDARYAWFSSILEEKDVLLTAHHQDDQAETLLLRLLRASGTRGLAAIPAIRPLGKGQLLRPLLEYSKAELSGYAETRELQWVDDESNQSMDFDRNYLRHQILPQFLSRWPQAVNQFARSAAHCRDDQVLLDELADLDLSQVRTNACEDWLTVFSPLNLDRFLDLSLARQRHLLQTILRRLTGHSIPGGKMREWLRQAATHTGEGQSQLRLNSVILAIYDRKIYFLRYLPSMAGRRYNWNPQQSLFIEALGIDLKLEYLPPKGHALSPLDGLKYSRGDTLQVHWREGGERIQLPGETCSRTLKKSLQEQRVPPWLRELLPLVSFQGTIVWSAALGDLSPRLISAEGQPLSICFSENKSNC